MKQFILGANELERLVEELVEKIPEGIVVLRGDLAAGKTTLVKAIAKKLGLSEDVTSPTFSLQQRYGEKVYHYDIYNHGLEHFVSLGMLEELEKEGLHFIEWGDDALVKILVDAGLATVVVDINKVTDNKREYKVDYAHA